MATSKIQPKSGGGSATYARLWTNQSPTSSFGQQDATLMLGEQVADITTFDAVRFVWKRVQGSTIDLDEWESNADAFECTYDLTNGKYVKYQTGYGRFVFSCASGTTNYYRNAYIADSSHIYFNSAFSRSTSTSAANTSCIPLFIDGVIFG